MPALYSRVALDLQRSRKCTKRKHFNIFECQHTLDGNQAGDCVVPRMGHFRYARLMHKLQDAQKKLHSSSNHERLTCISHDEGGWQASAHHDRVSSHPNARLSLGRNWSATAQFTCAFAHDDGPMAILQRTSRLCALLAAPCCCFCLCSNRCTRSC